MDTLYITDLDGTLLRNDTTLSRFSKVNLERLINEGLPFTFSTSRSPFSASLIKDLPDIKLPAVMMNGVCFADVKSKRIISSVKLDTKAIKEVCKAFEVCDRTPIIFRDTGTLDTQFMNSYSKAEDEYLVERQRLGNFNKVDEFLIDDKVIFMSRFDTMEKIREISEKLRMIKGISFMGYPDTYHPGLGFLEIFSKDGGKANGVKRFKKEYGFERIVAFGDNYNDLEMLKSADVGVAVENAPEDVKQAADIIIDSNENDGVVKYLLGVK